MTRVARVTALGLLPSPLAAGCEERQSSQRSGPAGRESLVGAWRARTTCQAAMEPEVP